MFERKIDIFFYLVYNIIKNNQKRAIMLALERQEKILDLLKEKSPLSVRVLSSKLYVSEATIRRDLIEMENQLLIRRMHGGAHLTVKEYDDIGLSYRKNEYIKEKEIIANLAFPLIKNSRAIFMDASSTVGILANMVKTKYSTIVTTGMETALKLSRDEDNNVILIGGIVSYSANSVSGAITVRQLAEFNFDTAIFSCAGIDKNFYATEKNIEQSAIKQQVIKQSKTKILLLDNSKFSVTNICKIAPIEQFDYIVTDVKPNDKFIQYATEHNVKIIY